LVGTTLTGPGKAAPVTGGGVVVNALQSKAAIYKSVVKFNNLVSPLLVYAAAEVTLK